MNFEGIETTDWLTAGMTPEELATVKALALISAEIYLRRKELGWNQKRFAQEMGVSQAMISKWESGDYNFTVGTLIRICHKLDLVFDPYVKNRDAEPPVFADPEEEPAEQSSTSKKRRSK